VAIFDRSHDLDRNGRLGLSYVLGRHVSGTAEFRRNDRRADDSSRDYTENSILLSLVGTF
jgi:hypothetical protein